MYFARLLLAPCLQRAVPPLPQSRARLSQPADAAVPVDGAAGPGTAHWQGRGAPSSGGSARRGTVFSSLLPFLPLQFFRSLLLCSSECFQQHFITVIWKINYDRRCLAGEISLRRREWVWCCRAVLLPSLCLATVSGCPEKEHISVWFCKRLVLVFMSTVSSLCCWCVSTSKYECKLTDCKTRMCFVQG